jgi:hypothetical protein
MATNTVYDADLQQAAASRPSRPWTGKLVERPLSPGKFAPSIQGQSVADGGEA